MRHILLHPGFHKTGTSSMQHFLWLNRKTLAPFFDLRMLRHLKPVVRLTGTYTRSKNALHLLDMVGLLDAAFGEFPVHNDRDLVISAEGLVGHLPGSQGVADYGAAPVLLTYITGYLADRFPTAEIKILFTTRDRDDWLFSTYKQHLRGQRLTLDFAAFTAKFQTAGDLKSIIAKVAKSLDGITIMDLAMADAQQHPLGPGAAVVDLMTVPATVRANLTPVGIGHAGPDQALWEQFLALNRSSLDDHAVADRKNALAQSADLGGWKPL